MQLPSKLDKSSAELKRLRVTSDKAGPFKDVGRAATGGGQGQ